MLSVFESFKSATIPEDDGDEVLPSSSKVVFKRRLLESDTGAACKTMLSESESFDELLIRAMFWSQIAVFNGDECCTWIRFSDFADVLSIRDFAEISLMIII